MKTETWKEEISRKLKERRVIALEGDGVLTSEDVLAVIDLIDGVEAERDEDAEWNHIQQLKCEKNDIAVGEQL